jgi:hypothetical protein
MTVWTATEIADAIGVNPKAFRSFVRSTVRSNGGKVGEQTPGSGGRYAFDDDGIDADAFIASWSAAYRAHARTACRWSMMRRRMMPLTLDRMMRASVRPCGVRSHRIA